MAPHLDLITGTSITDTLSTTSDSHASISKLKSYELTDNQSSLTNEHTLSTSNTTVDHSGVGSTSNDALASTASHGALSSGAVGADLLGGGGGAGVFNWSLAEPASSGAVASHTTTRDLGSPTTSQALDLRDLVGDDHAMSSSSLTSNLPAEQPRDSSSATHSVDSSGGSSQGNMGNGDSHLAAVIDVGNSDAAIVQDLLNRAAVSTNH